MRAAFTGVKERSYPAHAGLTSLGRSTPNARLRHEITGTAHAAVLPAGSSTLTFAGTPGAGQYKLLDFNPRLGAQFRLFRDTAGVDVVLAQYLDLTGQAVPEGEQVSGRGFLVENYDPIGAFSYWRSGELGGGSPGSHRCAPVNETAWFARDDLRPFGLMCLRMGRAPGNPAAGPARGSRPPAASPATGPGAQLPDPVGRNAGRPRTSRTQAAQ